MSLASVDLTVLAQKAIKHSGNRFWSAVVKHTTALLEDIVAEPSVGTEDFESADGVCTSDNLLLLARYYAGEIQKPKKKRMRTAETNWDKVQKILSNRPARIALTSIFLAIYMEAAMEECEVRSAKAEAAEHWSNDYAEVDRAEMWTTRQEAIDLVKSSWEECAEAAMTKNWEAFEGALGELAEIDA